jgi:predicted dehydrogenase
MKDLKAAIIGTGAAAHFHLHAYRKCAHTEVIAVCGSNAARADAFGRQFGIAAYTSIEELLRRERPDVVTVATLEWEHEQPVLLSLQAGSHVLCEKIMAHSVAIGERMVAAAARAGRTLGVNYNYRSVPSHRLIREELLRGSFGEIALYTATAHSYLWAHLIDLLRYFFGDRRRRRMRDRRGCMRPICSITPRWPRQPRFASAIRTSSPRWQARRWYRMRSASGRLRCMAVKARCQ